MSLVRTVTLLVVLITVVGSFLPGPAKERLGTQASLSHTSRVGSGHRAYHLFTFALIAGLLSLGSLRFRGELLSCVAALALGYGIEVTQWSVGLSERFEWWDVKDDLLGVAFAFVAVQLLNFFSRRVPEPPSKAD